MIHYGLFIQPMCEHVTGENQSYPFSTFLLIMSMLSISYCSVGLQKHFIRRASPFITQKKKKKITI